MSVCVCGERDNMKVRYQNAECQVGVRGRGEPIQRPPETQRQRCSQGSKEQEAA